MFDFVKVSHNDPLLLEVFKLRYKVYCEEWGFERPEDHPDGIERDEFDAHDLDVQGVLQSRRCRPALREIRANHLAPKTYSEKMPSLGMRNRFALGGVVLSMLCRTTSVS